MKLKINGMEIEGELEELLTFAKEYSKGMQEFPDDKRVIRQKQRRVPGSVDKLLPIAVKKYEQENMSLSRAIKDTLGYCCAEYLKKAKAMIPEGVSHRRIKSQVRNTDKSRKRLEYINQRVKTLTYDNKMSYEKALSIASEEYKQTWKTHPIAQPALDNTPRLLYDDKNNDLLLAMLKGMIANKGSMTYHNEGAILNIRHGYEWKALVGAIDANRSQICQYFNVKDLFHIEPGDNVFRMRISYG